MSEFSAVEITGKYFEKLNKDDIMESNFLLFIFCLTILIFHYNFYFRPSGEAVAEFETEDDARAAMAKNREYMGERFIVLTPQGFKD